MDEEEDDSVFNLKHADGKELLLLGHDMNSMEFTYYGSVRGLERDPHGFGVAFCTSNRQHCYLGRWYKGQLKGLGQRFVESTVGKSVFYGNFVGVC